MVSGSESVKKVEVVWIGVFLEWMCEESLLKIVSDVIVVRII